MRSPLRIATTFLGVFFALQGLVWIAKPGRAAEGLGMPLLDGLGRSTQIGDFASFFLAAGTTMILGARTGNARLLLVPAGMLGAAAVVRTLAWALHGAAFAAAFIAIEVAVAALLVVAVRRLDAAG
ncbi:MAG: hypothetical protein H6Q91_560 [Deltaproteobacteria bacterium]|nr:hypothetical protein [Deltaproteobacteria bacterium]